MINQGFPHGIPCQLPGCIEEVTHNLDLVRWYEGFPICEVCYETKVCVDTDQLANVECCWDELPEITVEDLK